MSDTSAAFDCINMFPKAREVFIRWFTSLPALLSAFSMLFRSNEGEIMNWTNFRSNPRVSRAKTTYALTLMAALAELPHCQASFQGHC